MFLRDLSRPRALCGIAGAAVLASGALAVLGVVAPTASGATTPTAPTASKTFAGYGETLTGTGSNTVTTTFTVPALNCASTPTAAGTLAEESGLFGGFGTKSFLESFGVVAGQCKNGAAAYAAAAVAGKSIALATFLPAAGDTVTIAATESASGSSVVITDTTQEKQFTKTGTGVTAQGALVGLAPKNATTEIPTFTTVGFSTTINGAVLASSAKAFNLVSGSTTKISTGTLSGTAASAWTETFGHN
jgi:hypothetical protein